MKTTALLLLLAAVLPALPIVNLTVQERAGMARLDEPVLMGVPLPGSAYYADPALFSLRDQSGNVIPCEFRVAATWLKAPQAIRWLHLDFTLPSLDSAETRVLTLHSETSPQGYSSPLSVVDSGSAFVVNTGVVRFRVRKANFNIIDGAWVDESGAENYGPTNRIVLPNGSGLIHEDSTGVFMSSLDGNTTVVVERQGPHSVQFLAKGRLMNASGDSSFHFITRITAYAGSRDVRVAHVIEYWSVDVKSFKWITDLRADLPLDLSATRTARLGIPGGSDSAVLAPEDTIFGLTRRAGGNFTILSFVTGGRAAPLSINAILLKPRDIGWISLSDGARGAAVARRYFWEMFPACAEARGNGVLSACLYSRRQEQPFRIYAGVSRTFETRYLFFNDDPASEQRQRLAGAMNRLYALAPASWYGRVTGGLIPVVEKDPMLFPDTIRAQIQAVEVKMDTNFNRLFPYMDRFPKYGNYCYGLLRWGDDLHYNWNFLPGQLQEDWNLAWNGNYYGMDIMCFNRFMRTADPAWLDYASAHAQQVEDVHQVHLGNVSFSNGGCRYCPPTNHIAADGLEAAIQVEDPSHHKTQGMFSQYYLLGSERALGTALEGARWIGSRFGYSFAVPGENLSVYIRRLSNLLHSQTWAYAQTRDRFFHDNIWRNWFFIKKDIRDNEAIGQTWMIGLFHEALIDMYDVCDDSIADSIPAYFRTLALRYQGQTGVNTAVGFAFLSRFYGATTRAMALSKLAGLGTSYGNYHKELALSCRGVDRALYYLATRDSVDKFGIGIESKPYVPFIPQDALSLSPNPLSRGQAMRLVSGDKDISAEIRVYDLRGREVAVLQPDVKNTLWPAKTTPAGVYLLKIKAGKKVQALRAAVMP